MVPFQVIILEEHLPSSLTTGQALWLFEVGEVFMVGDNRDWVGSAGKILAPIHQRMYDREELSVVDVVVSFGGGEGLREIGTGVEIAVGVFLHEHSARGGERGVGHDEEGFVVVGE